MSDRPVFIDDLNDGPPADPLLLLDWYRRVVASRLKWQVVVLTSGPMTTDDFIGRLLNEGEQHGT